jgi:hypothetical protein
MEAAEWGRAEVVKLLLAAGADIHTKDKVSVGAGLAYSCVMIASVMSVAQNGRTALALASQESSAEVVTLLLAAGADVGSLDKVSGGKWGACLYAMTNGPVLSDRMGNRRSRWHQ